MTKNDPGTIKGLLLLALANIRRDLLRTTLLCLTIALASLLFIISLASMAGMEAPVEKMLDRQKAAHMLISFDARIYPPSKISGWFSGDERVEEIGTFWPYVQTSGRPMKGGKLFGDTLRLTERIVSSVGIDQLKFINGKEQASPAPGEIWLPTSTAQSGNIEVGDIIEIPTNEGAIEYTVSAIVVDPHYSSGFSNPVRVWIAPGELAAIYTPRMLQNFQLGVHLKDISDQEAVWRDFSSGLEGGFAGGITTYKDGLNSYGTMLRMLAVMILIFGIISLVVAMFIISSTISGVIMANYRTFGVLKSLGYTPSNVSSIFQIQFLLLSLVAVPLGIVAGWGLSKQLIAIMLKSIGTIDTALPFVEPASITLLTMVGIIAITAAISGRKAGQIKAASSIRFGAPEQGVKRRIPANLTWAKYLPLSLVIGLKNAASGGRRIIYDLMIFTITAFVLFFSINVYNSMQETGKNLPFWGFDGSEINVKVNANDFTMRYETVKKYLKAFPGVQTIAGLSISGDALLPPTDIRAALPISGHIIDGDADAIGFINLEGRNPSAVGEISLGVNLVKDYGYKLGDEVKLDVFGQPLTFTLIGVFQGSSNNGYWYRMTLDSSLQADPNFLPDTVGMITTDEVDRQIIMDDLEVQLGEAVDVEASEKFIEAQLNQIVGGIGLVVTFLSVVFLLVSSVSIFNSTTIGIHESKRQLGIYNALGYTRTQIRFILVNKSVVVGLIGTLLGLGAFWLLAQPLMSSLTAGVGMPQFPIIFDVIHSFLAIPLIIFVSMLSAWIPSNNISKIKARTLIVE